mgnify:CR=1 FL=1
MELYKQIKRYRTDMNLSQEELAEKIYVTRQTISKLGKMIKVIQIFIACYC